MKKWIEYKQQARALWKIFGCFAVFAVTAGPAFAIDLANGLVAHYALSKDATDSSGNGLNGTAMSGVSFANGYAEFDGTTNAWIDLPDGFSDFSSGFSFSGWVKYDSFTENYSRVFDLSLGENNNNVLLAHTGTASGLTYDVRTSAALDFTAYYTQSEWVHVAVVHGTDNSVKIYKNGVEFGTGTSNLPAVVTRTENFLGRSAWATDGYLKGALKDLRFYNRALTVNEVTELAKRTIYVSYDGIHGEGIIPEGIAPYISWETSTADLTNALVIAGENDTILIADGVYRAGSQTAYSTIPAGVTLKSVNGASKTVLNGYQNTFLGYVMSSNTVLEGLTLRDYVGGVVHGDSVATSTINDCVIEGCNAQLLLGQSVASHVTLNRCVIQGCQTSLGRGLVANSELNNCLVQGNVAIVPSSAAGIEDCTAVNCTIVNNTLFTGAESEGAVNSTLKNCLVVGNTVSGCTITDSYYPGAVADANGNIADAPVFVDATNGNYRLAYGSSGIDAGDNADVVGTLDLDGYARIGSSTVDMGAYETYDADSDQLTDAQERMVYKTDPAVSDSDGDGFNDGTEVAQGMSPTVNNTAFLQNYVSTNAESLGYYTQSALLDLRAGDVGIAISGGNATLNLQMEESDDLTSWNDAGAAVQWVFPVSGEKKFLRVRAEAP